MTTQGEGRIEPLWVIVVGQMRRELVVECWEAVAKMIGRWVRSALT